MDRKISYASALERMKRELGLADRSLRGHDVPADAVRDAIRQAFEDTANEDTGAPGTFADDAPPVDFDSAIVAIVGVVGREPVKGAPAPRWPEAALSRQGGVRAAAFRRTLGPGEADDDPGLPFPTYTGLVSTNHGPMEVWDDGERVFVELPDAGQPTALGWRGAQHRLLPLPGRENMFEVDGLSAVNAADIVDGEF